MKLFPLTFLFSTFSLGAQTCEPIQSITRVQKSFDYYFEQSVLWEREVKKNPENNNAWLNCFLAARYANHFSKEATIRFKLKEIVAQAKRIEAKRKKNFYCSLLLQSRNFVKKIS